MMKRAARALLATVPLLASPALATDYGQAALAMAKQAQTVLSQRVPGVPVGIVLIGQSVTHNNVPPVAITASISGSTLTVSAVASGVIETATGNTLGIGATIVGANIPAGVQVTSQASGTLGGAGIYMLNKTAGTIASEAMLANVAGICQSITNPIVSVPLTGATSTTCGANIRLYDDARAHGIDLKIVNAAKGSSSLVSQWVGQVALWQPNQAGFYQQRKPVSPPDRGFYGSVIVPAGNKAYLATSARDISVMNVGPFLAAGSNTANIDYIQFGQTAQSTSGAGITGSISGSVLTVTGVSSGSLAVGQCIYGISATGLCITSPGTGTGGTGTYNLSGSATQALASFSTGPDFYTPSTIGQTVTDGTITWTYVSPTAGAYGGSALSVLTEGNSGFGWDPLGLSQNAFELGRAVTGVVDLYFYIDGNQSDLNQTSARRQAAVVSEASFLLNRGGKVIIGNQIYSPASGSQAAHVTENAANLAAYNQLKAGPFSAKVFWGADLYTALGTNAVANGLMQADQIHTNGAGSIAQGDAYWAAIRTILQGQGVPVSYGLDLPANETAPEHLAA